MPGPPGPVVPCGWFFASWASRAVDEVGMIREDRELLAELAQLNNEMPSLALRVLEGCASAGEQRHYAQRLIEVGGRLQRRADQAGVIEGEVLVVEPPSLPAHAVERGREQ